MQLEIPTQRRAAVLSVSELNWRLRATIDKAFASVWVAGEISNFKTAPSGHSYFVLKDAKAQISTVMFRSAAARVKFRPKDGMEVVVGGRVGLYEQRGNLQLYVDSIEPQGVGSAQLALQQLKEKLQAEGLFAPERKQPLPPWPTTVGVVTALRGAAVHDVITTLRARMPQVRIVVRPVVVQGKQAGGEIAAAIRDLESEGSADVLIVGRGGGSVEDLWAFNEERVARAIARCRIPIVSAVGHEVDVTLADLVADQRAATPTAAAAAVTPDCREAGLRVERLRRSLLVAAQSAVARHRSRLDSTGRRLRDPRAALQAQRIRIDDLGDRARRAVETLVRLARERTLRGAARLDALSPLAVLDRGYAIARDPESGRVVRSSAELAVDDRLDLRFAEGRATVRVEETE